MAESRDSLTGLLNRGVFDNDAQKDLEKSLSQDQPHSLIMVDVDHFKKVNDDHGHQAGDAVLREVARRIISAVEGKGRAYRYGGEEFAVILPNYSLDEALATAERIRQLIEEEAIERIQVTASFGVSCAPDNASEIEKLIKTADDALYDAKNRGRNLVRFFGEPAPTKSEPRKPKRKAAQVGQLTESQIEDIRHHIVRRVAPECPFDRAYLEIEDATTVGDVGRHYFVMCPECGFSAEV